MHFELEGSNWNSFFLCVFEFKTRLPIVWNQFQIHKCQNKVSLKLKGTVQNQRGEFEISSPFQTHPLPMLFYHVFKFEMGAYYLK